MGRDHSRARSSRPASLLALGLRPVQAREIANEAWAKLYEKRAELATLSFPGLAITQARFLAIDALRVAARERRRALLRAPTRSASTQSPAKNRCGPSRS